MNPQSPASLSTLEAHALISPPPSFLCPITTDVMRDPVSTIDGYCYERFAIEKWFSCHNTSPMTNLPLKSKTLTPQVRFTERNRKNIRGNHLTSCDPTKLGLTFQVVLRQSIEEWWDQNVPSNQSSQSLMNHSVSRANRHSEWDPEEQLINSAEEEALLGITRSEMRELLVLPPPVSD
jgi:hypothetical protein